MGIKGNVKQVVLLIWEQRAALTTAQPFIFEIKISGLYHQIKKSWTLCQIYQKAWNETGPLIFVIHVDRALIVVMDHTNEFNCRQSLEILSLEKIAYPVLYDLQSSILLRLNEISSFHSYNQQPGLLCRYRLFHWYKQVLPGRRPGSRFRNNCLML